MRPFSFPLASSAIGLNNWLPPSPHPPPSLTASPGSNLTVEVPPTLPGWCKLLLTRRRLPPDCGSAGAAWLQVNPCGGGGCGTRVGRENQLAWMWALDGARHTLEIASWRVVSRRVRGVMGLVMGLWGQVKCCRSGACLVWAQEGARHTSEMPTWRSKRVCWCSWMALDWELRLLPLVELALLTDLAGWVGWGLHGFWPGIDESTPDKGRARRGRALGRIFIPWRGLGQGLGVKGGEGRGERFPNPFHLQFSFSRHFWVSTLLQIGWLYLHKTEELLQLV